MKNNFILDLCVYFNPDKIDRCQDYFNDLILLVDFIIRKITISDTIILLLILIIVYRILSKLVKF